VNKSSKRAFVLGVAVGAGAAEVELALEAAAGRAEAPAARAMTMALRRVGIIIIVDQGECFAMRVFRWERSMTGRKEYICGGSEGELEICFNWLCGSVVDDVL
jgi:hypothetical protein